MDDNYSFFSFAIIWGEFEILNYKHPLRRLDAYNPYPYNQTMHVIGYVGHSGVGFIYKNASRVYCPWWLGFVRQHSLFVIGWGIVSRFGRIINYLIKARFLMSQWKNIVELFVEKLYD
jgi:hypothetical protein